MNLSRSASADTFSRRPASTDISIPRRAQINITLGDLGYNLIYYWVTAFITIYYTDIIGVSAFIVSGLLLWVRLFDALNDPLMGMLCDRTRSRWGRYRPWVALGGVLTSIFMIALFNANPEWSSTAKIAYMYIMYILLTIAATICNMSYAAMISVATTNGRTRAELAGKRQLFVNVGNGILGMIAVSAVGKLGGGNERMGYLFAVIITVVIGLPLLLNSVRVSKEVVTPAAEKKAGVRELFACVFGNKCAVVCVGCFLLLGFSSYGKAAMYTYYFKYYVGDYSLYSSYSLVNMIGCVIGAAMVSWLVSKHSKNRGHDCAKSLLISAVFYGFLYVFPAPSAMYYVCIILCGVFHGMSTALMTSAIPDCVDMSEYRYGVRSDGFLSAFMSFCMKTGGAIGPAVLIAVMGQLGYTANGVQNSEVLTVINGSISLLPCVLYIVMAILLFVLYDLDDMKHQHIVNELDKRRRGLC